MERPQTEITPPVEPCFDEREYDRVETDEYGYGDVSEVDWNNDSNWNEWDEWSEAERDEADWL